ncbi:MAG: nicotinate-nucleotide--dimethylbenzimidazole phosphoribosyltransferase [Oscillospiraceae bacterium]|jgi:nicotinate-nucleotide--dimethylbenzimidazole phosphoribosyltransferase|nr:nicotinate-nucleotide--dimethylbenzimidazole phosphoribosyltransferase [Oscillospiraceae bacterium]
MDYSFAFGGAQPPDECAAAEARARWDSVAKPLGSLGLLEDAVVKIAALTGSSDVRIDNRALFVLCADNGVVSEGVSQSGSEVTMIVAENLTRGDTAVCRMAAVARADVIPVDMGMASRPSFGGLVDRRVGDGTQNIALGPAMTRDQACEAIVHGVELARRARGSGRRLLATGEMGIGNTTTSSAVAAVLMGLPAESVTGRGSGLGDGALYRKIAVIKRAIALNRPDPDDALDVLAKLGGFDIAGMAGLFLGGAIYKIPVLIDGFISSCAALAASRLMPSSTCAMLSSHVSGEPAGGAVLKALGLRPLINAGMRLGEGTGAIAAIPLLDMALAVYHGSSSFSDIGMDAYRPPES